MATLQQQQQPGPRASMRVQIGALAWKHWLVKRRSFFSLVFEVFVPALAVGLTFIFFRTRWADVGFSDNIPSTRAFTFNDIIFPLAEQGSRFMAPDVCVVMSDETWPHFESVLRGDRSEAPPQNASRRINTRRYDSHADWARDITEFGQRCYMSVLETTTYGDGGSAVRDGGARPSHYAYDIVTQGYYAGPYRDNSEYPVQWSFAIDTQWRRVENIAASPGGIFAMEMAATAAVMHARGAVKFAPGNATASPVQELPVLTPLQLDAAFTLHPVTMPMPDRRRPPFYGDIETSMLTLLLSSSFAYTLIRVSSMLVREKETRMRELMRMMGMPAAVLSLSYLALYSIMFVVGAFFTAATTIASDIARFDIVFIYMILGYVCTYAMATCFTALFDRARTVTILSSFTYFGMLLFCFLAGPTSSRSMQFVVCLFPPAALGLTLRAIIGFGAQYDAPLTWSMLNVPVQGFHASTGLSMLVFDAVALLFLSFYLEQTVPSQYGIHRPFWFLCESCRLARPQQKRRRKKLAAAAKKKNDDEMREVLLGYADDTGDHICDSSVSDDEDGDQSTALIEPADPHWRVAVRTRGLVKTFSGSETSALDALDVSMYDNQITALVGRNGAGKSTLLGILTGLYRATAGTAHVQGIDLATGTDEVRAGLSVCPQYDVLYDDLTVLEHGLLFAALKGVPAETRTATVLEMLRRVGLGAEGDNKIYSYASALSGGQKRKLSVANALLGEYKTLVLDEPTLSMDLASQRLVWNLLLEARAGRTILLATNNMEEAEVGDRVLLMGRGKLRAAGSSAFLKRAFGVGYTLTITKRIDVVAQNASAAVPGGDDSVFVTASGQRMFTAIHERFPFVTALSDAAAELSLSIPFGREQAAAGQNGGDGDGAPDTPALLEFLDDNKAALGIAAYAVAVTSLTEVFMRAGDANDNEEEGTKKGDVAASADAGTDRKDDASAVLGVRGEATFKTQFRALFIKRALVSYRDSYQAIMSLLFPAALIAFTALLLIVPFYMSVLYTEIPFTPTLYPQEVRIAFLGEHAAADVRSFADPEVARFALAVAANTEGSNENAFGVPVPFGFTTPGDCEQGILDAGEYYRARVFTQPRVEFDVMGALVCSVENLPVVPDSTAPSRLEIGLLVNRTASDALPVQWIALTNAMLASTPGAPTVSMRTRERAIGSAEGGTPMMVSVSLMAEIFLLFTLMSTITLHAAAGAWYVVTERVTRSRHLQIISGARPIAYWASAFTWDVVSFIPSICVLSVFANIVGKAVVGGELSTEFQIQRTLSAVLFLPAMAAFSYSVAFLFKVPDNVQPMLLQISLWGFSFSSLSVLPMTVIFPFICILTVLIVVFFPPMTFAMLLMMPRISGHPWTPWTVLYMCFLVLQTVFYAGIVLLQERFMPGGDWRKPQRVVRTKHKATTAEELSEPRDTDVAAEADAIESGLCDDATEFPIVLRGLRRVYERKPSPQPLIALSNLSFSVARGEVLGFVGGNGAGKSTTLKILTGEVRPNAGAATLMGLDVVTQQHVVRRGVVGYCPQFDALVPQLTGREQLTFFARIKGVPESDVPGVVNTMLRRTGLTGVADRPTATYSCGNTRILSVAVALIGDPPVVILDEPATGLDPQAKRAMWRLISSTMANRALIMSSHSPEEVEALCDRAAVMSAGKLQCIGSPAHLRAKFGNCYQVVIKAAGEAQCEAVMGAIAAQLPAGAAYTVVELHDTTGKLHVPRGALPIARIFRMLQELQRTRPDLGLVSYVVSDADLEQIFLDAISSNANLDGDIVWVDE